jgi:AraC-like DNA-binding protein
VRARGPGRSGAGLDPGFSADVRRVLETELLRGGCSARTIARLFAMHRRTLNRRLSAEGTGFRRVMDTVRFELACRLLADPRMTFAQVAAALKYSEPSAFTRAFRRWSGGQTPTAWRAQHRKGRPGSKRKAARSIPSDPQAVAPSDGPHVSTTTQT